MLWAAVLQESFDKVISVSCHSHELAGKENSSSKDDYEVLENFKP